MTHGSRHDSQTVVDGAVLVESLLAKCQTLLNELREFSSFVEKRKAEQEHAVEIRKFQTAISTEYKSLQRVRSIYRL